MGGLFSFLNLEPRRGGGGPEPPVPEAERLRAEGKHRFASGPGLAAGAGNAQPFHRCAVCEAENGRFTERCTNCGASLTTPEQRAYNDALWEKIRSYKQQMDEAPRVTDDPATRAYREKLARTVASAEQARLR